MDFKKHFGANAMGTLTDKFGIEWQFNYGAGGM